MIVWLTSSSNRNVLNSVLIFLIEGKALETEGPKRSVLQCCCPAAAAAAGKVDCWNAACLLCQSERLVWWVCPAGRSSLSWERWSSSSLGLPPPLLLHSSAAASPWQHPRPASWLQQTHAHTTHADEMHSLFALSRKLQHFANLCLNYSDKHVGLLRQIYFCQVTVIFFSVNLFEIDWSNTCSTCTQLRKVKNIQVLYEILGRAINFWGELNLTLAELFNVQGDTVSILVVKVNNCTIIQHIYLQICVLFLLHSFFFCFLYLLRHKTIVANVSCYCQHFTVLIVRQKTHVSDCNWVIVKIK